MEVWLVGIGGVESSDVRYVCLSEESALERWNELRLELITEAQESISRHTTNGMDGYTDIDERIIKNLSETDPYKLDNYPQDAPFMHKMETEP